MDVSVVKLAFTIRVNRLEREAEEVIVHSIEKYCSVGDYSRKPLSST